MITPEYISNLVKFDASREDGKSSLMFKLQEEGASKVYNLLEQYGIALLADEVGMGKTLQALSICAALWNEKPDARILILAPREEVANNWRNEYNTFIYNHYDRADNNVKSISGNLPVKPMISCSNLYDLTDKVKKGWGQLFIGKITSFSFLMANENRISGNKQTSGNRAKAKADDFLSSNNRIARRLKKNIDAQADDGKPYFDLLIIDEAHYFRNIKADSLRVNTAKEFFGHPDSKDNPPLARRVLLMTATPNHSSDEDIKSILSYFSSRYNNDSHTEILNKICVRRFRRLGKEGFIKYQYRNEIPSPSDFKEDPLGEMFFGLYQHELAKEFNKNSQNPSGRGTSRMMKYLEGVEFIPSEDKIDEEEIDETSSATNSGDFSRGTDFNILSGISKKYLEIFQDPPQHPKYVKLVEDLTASDHREKVVVFVRRIASVIEIAKRIILSYDKKMWSRLQHSELSSLNYDKLDRSSFSRILRKTVENDSNPEDGSAEEESRNVPSCKVLNLFKVSKKDRFRSTDASNFRNRFAHSKAYVFSMFFSPAYDYNDKPYEDMVSYRYKGKSDILENYYNSALLSRLKFITDQGIAGDIENSLISNSPENEGQSVKKGSLDTLFSIFWKVFKADTNLEESYRKKIVDSYAKLSIYEKEGLSNFIEKGTLLASDSIVWFYDIFRNIPENSERDVTDTYRIFCDKVASGLTKERLYTQIQESILNFSTLYVKEFGINSPKILVSEGWENFNGMQPIYPYNADNSSHKVLKSFNTPFYPDMLVATSVLQEGVNLQYFCSSIYHYGRAWTPGDNEQRTGRIDRMFGKIERMLDSQSGATLDIFYPYLRNNIDQKQLADFVRKKFEAERVIDGGGSYAGADSSGMPDDEDNTGWEKFLRKPDAAIMDDPYPVKQSDFDKVKTSSIPKQEVFSFDHFFESIKNAIKGMSDLPSEIFFIDSGGEYKLLVDPSLRNGRKQPVMIDIVLDPVGSGFMKQAVYCLRMRTPLAPSAHLRDLRGNFYQNREIQDLYKPGIKLSLDPSNSLGPNWGLYMSSELPLFYSDLDQNPLSEKEIQDSFISLILCADKTEHILFGRDLLLNELSFDSKIESNNAKNSFRQISKQHLEHGWKEVGNYLILEETGTGDPLKDPERESLIFNHKHLYIKARPQGKQLRYQISFLYGDAQKEELELMERHLVVLRKEN